MWRHFADRIALLRRSENHDWLLVHPWAREGGGKVDQMAHVFPTALPKPAVGCSHVQAFGRGHQPVEADESEPVVCHNLPELDLPVRGNLGGIFGEGERGDLNAVIADPFCRGAG